MAQKRPEPQGLGLKSTERAEETFNTISGLVLRRNLGPWTAYLNTFWSLKCCLRIALLSAGAPRDQRGLILEAIKKGPYLSDGAFFIERQLRPEALT